MSRQCRGYANSLPIVAPYISGLSTTSSILGTTTIVTIFGENFRNYSTVYFGTTLINNVTYFSSGQLSFYVPAIATVGTYPIQVFNDTLGSNIVSFTIDNSVGFWNQDPPGTGPISNNNASGGVNINGTLTVTSPICLNYSPPITTTCSLGYYYNYAPTNLIWASGATAIGIAPVTFPVDGIWSINYSVIGTYNAGTVGIDYGQYGISTTSNTTGILTNANTYLTPITASSSSNNNWGTSNTAIINTIDNGTKNYFLVYNISINGSGGSTYKITIAYNYTRIA